MTSSSIYQDWPGFEPYEAIYNRTGLFDSSPLYDTLEGFLDAYNYTIHRNVMTGAVDVETGEFAVYDFDDLEPSEYSTGVVLSASVPFVFPYTHFKGRYLMDALSCGWNVNMLSAIDKCRQKVDHDSKIIVDIIVMYPETN